MTKVQVNEVKVGDVIKVKVHTNPDGSRCLVKAHTKSAQTVTVTEQDTTGGRYISLGVSGLEGLYSLFMGRASKVTVVD